MGNPAATASAVFGLLAVLSMPAAYVLQYYSDAVTLLQSTSAAGLAIVFGLYAILRVGLLGLRKSPLLFNRGLTHGLYHCRT